MTTIGELCMGYGGLGMGLSLALGVPTRVAWAVEYDKHPSAIIAHRYPGVPNYGDVNAADWSQIWEDTVMSAPRNDERAEEMYRRYQQGVSLAVVAAEFACTRQSVYVIFKRRGWELHPRPPGRLFQVLDGQRYTLRNNGYYAATSGDREYLHRRVWMNAHGDIPDGFDVHHLDHDKSNNSLDNLAALPKDEHSRLYGTGCNAHVHRCNPDCVEEVVPTDSPAVDWLTAGYP